jgi:MFS family permease
MRIRKEAARGSSGAMLRGIWEGFRYAFGFPPIRSILLLVGLVSLVAMPYAVLMPVFARDILGGGPNTLGFLMAAAGVGALGGALYLASRTTVRGLGSLIASTAVVTGASLAAFSESRSPALSYVIMTVVGFGMIVLAASSNTVLQTLVDDDKRGRVMSLYAMAFLGMSPFGNLLAGALADRIGAPATVLLGGLACIAGGLEFARRLPRLREMVRPIYVRMGIIREMATGLQAATDLTDPPES